MFYSSAPSNRVGEYGLTGSPLPHRLLRMREPQVIEDAINEVLDEIVDRFRAVIKGRHRRKDDCSQPRQFQHILQVNGAQRRFPHGEDQPPILLEGDFRGSMNEIHGDAIGYSSERATATGNDDHCVNRVGSTGDDRADRVNGEHADFRRGESKYADQIVILKRWCGEAKLFGDDLPPAIAHDEVNPSDVQAGIEELK